MGINGINNADRTTAPRVGHVRSKSAINRLKMYSQKAIRNRGGEILGGQYMSRTPTAGKVARVQPNRRWFGNTRTITQKHMDTFREEITANVNDPYTVILKQKGVPMGLLVDAKRTASMNLLTADSYKSTFGKKSTRKKPTMKGSSTLEDLLRNVHSHQESYDEVKDSNQVVDPCAVTNRTHLDPLFSKGQSKRIWGELYKVIDSADVLIQVLDARDPIGTRSKHVEAYLKKNAPHKHLIFVLNKCDLVPTWVSSRWVRVLSEEKPTMAFHASITNSFGKGALIQLLRQFSALHKDRQQISVGFIGYPSVGKSSIINTLRKKAVCKVSPVPGETKVWQYITLFKRVFLIDCPGVVPADTGDDETAVLLKGVVRVENLEDPLPHIQTVLDRVQLKHIRDIYGIDKWIDSVDFIAQLARARGKLLKLGEPDYKCVSKMVLNDWQRGKLPWFEQPPANPDASTAVDDTDVVVPQLTTELDVVQDWIDSDKQDPIE